ncbi:hypothetical protein ACFPM0_36500 [Pseudonocardia sulfidoxydans]|uniref:hypothetical protein n=1 Tax=Pseudonocardia sulfidoxydans TaxID=54011 RepID=UPI0036219CEB
MAGAVAVPGPSGQVRAQRGGPRAGTLDRGRVDYPDRVVPQVGVGGQDPDQALDQRYVRFPRLLGDRRSWLKGREGSLCGGTEEVPR